MAIALVLDKALQVDIRNVDIDLSLGPKDVRVAVEAVGICGSDIQYYREGKIGPFVVDEPMVLGHEAAGVVVECGAEVRHLQVGDRVCIEPGIPNFESNETRLGLYNLDPELTFWATPPIHGCLTPEIVHPAVLTYKIPDHMSFAEGAMVEPLAVGLQAINKTGIQAGDVALVFGAGPIGILTALGALAAGCTKVLIYDPVPQKLEIAASYTGIHALSTAEGTLLEQVLRHTHGQGVDVVYECSGAAAAFDGVADYIKAGGVLSCVGMPSKAIPMDIVALQLKEITVTTSFRYANVYTRAIDLIATKKIDVLPLISATYDFHDGVEAFERAHAAKPDDIKIQIAFTRN